MNMFNENTGAFIDVWMSTRRAITKIFALKFSANPQHDMDLEIKRRKEQMSISDTIKKSVLERLQATDLTTTSIAIVLGMAILLGLYIYAVYRFNAKSGFYNRGFNKTLAILPVVTAAIMLAMGSNLTISLGMVGALSIVRFRNAVKEPADLMFLFWSISLGIIVGAGLFELSIILSLVVSALVLLLDLLPSVHAPGLVVVSGTDVGAEAELIASIKMHSKLAKIRSRNITQKGVEWIIEVQLQNGSELVKDIAVLQTVNSVHLMTHDGEVRF